MFPPGRLLFLRWVPRRWAGVLSRPPCTLWWSHMAAPLAPRCALRCSPRSASGLYPCPPLLPPLHACRPFKPAAGAAKGGEAPVWDAVWVDAGVLMAEGILVSKAMMSHHRM